MSVPFRNPGIWVLLLGLTLSACGSGKQQPTVPTVTTLSEDPILLSRVLERCNANPAAVATAECVNARAASDRTSGDQEAAKAKKAQAGFEMAREARRRADAAAAQLSEGTTRRVDAYDLPVEGGNAPAGEPRAP